MREYFRDVEQIQVLGSGPHDVLAFVKRPVLAGKRAGIDHFGFRLTDPKDIDGAVSEITAAGAKLLRRREHGPGVPFAYFEDQDGYEMRSGSNSCRTRPSMTVVESEPWRGSSRNSATRYEPRFGTWMPSPSISVPTPIS